MLVKNTKDGLVGLNLNISLPTDILALKPGWQDVNDERWRKARVRYALQINDGVYLEVGNEIPATDKDNNPIYKIDEDGKQILDGNGQPIQEKIFVGTPLNKCKLAVATEIVNGCNDKVSLKKWYDIEGREDVRLAISKRLDALDHKRKKEEDE